MLGRIRRFIQRNIGRIALGAVAIPVFIRITGYAARKYLTYQATKTHELLRRYKKQRMFEMMEENFESTYRKWFDLMKETIKKTLDADKYAEMLKKGDGNKMENWMEMKIIAFSSILALVYGSSLLTVLLRIQVNVISGLLFKQMEDVPPGLEAMGGAGDADGSSNSSKGIITEEIQQEYMILTRYLCTDGVKHLCKLMQDKTRQVIEHLPLKQKLTVEDIEQLFSAIRERELNRYQSMRMDVEDNDAAELNDWCPITEAWFFMCSVKLTKKFLYPRENYEQKETNREAFLRTLVGEAFDLVKSTDAKTLLKFLETQGINNYLDRISDFLNTLPPPNPDSDESHASEEGQSSEPEIIFTEISAPVAKLIPVMNSFINVPFSEDTWIAILLNNESLKSYSANIYESYSSKDFD